MTNELNVLRGRGKQLETQVASLRGAVPYRGIRKRSSTELFGLPLWEIATGPDAAKNEAIGHAKAIIAIGDHATGALAIGGLAQGLIAIGGGAIGALLAVGGGAVGGIAIGGGAIGYYAVGGGTKGKYVYSARRRDPEVAQLAKKIFRCLKFILS